MRVGNYVELPEYGVSGLIRNMFDDDGDEVLEAEAPAAIILEMDAPGPDGNKYLRVTFSADLRVIASSGEGWDHVSVSLPGRCPNWPEMEYVKRLFFKDSEAAMQLHVPPDDHINCHPNCLHLWRPLKGEIPRPPAILVGPKTRGAT